MGFSVFYKNGTIKKYNDFNFENEQEIISLNCSGNQLTSLPESIGNLINLEILGCYNNQLTSLPESIGNLINLKYFYCCGNRLTSLGSKSIGNLVNLEVFYCNSNQLTSLPESIGNLANLTNFYCNNNHLTSLPETLVRCRNVYHLNIQNNPIERMSLRLKRFIEGVTKRPLNIKVYNDEQNVHNSTVNDSVKKSLEVLLKEKKTEGLNLGDFL